MAFDELAGQRGKDQRLAGGDVPLSMVRLGEPRSVAVIEPLPELMLTAPFRPTSVMPADPESMLRSVAGGTPTIRSTSHREKIGSSATGRNVGHELFRRS